MIILVVSFFLGCIVSTVCRNKYQEIQNKRKCREIKELKEEIRRINSRSVDIGDTNVLISPDGDIKTDGKNWKMPNKIN